MEQHGRQEPPLVLQEHGGLYLYQGQDSIKPCWFMAAIFGHHLTMEQPGRQEPRPEIEIGIQYQYQAQVNTKPRWFTMAVSGRPLTME
jgi:hypothetical protein